MNLNWGLHEKHAVVTLNLGTISAYDDLNNI
jgi:hypothetical protein